MGCACDGSQPAIRVRDPEFWPAGWLFPPAAPWFANVMVRSVWLGLEGFSPWGASASGPRSTRKGYQTTEYGPDGVVVTWHKGEAGSGYYGGSSSSSMDAWVKHVGRQPERQKDGPPMEVPPPDGGHSDTSTTSGDEADEEPTAEEAARAEANSDGCLFWIDYVSGHSPRTGAKDKVIAVMSAGAGGREFGTTVLDPGAWLAMATGRRWELTGGGGVNEGDQPYYYYWTACQSGRIVYAAIFLDADGKIVGHTFTYNTAQGRGKCKKENRDQFGDVFCEAP